MTRVERTILIVAMAVLFGVMVSVQILVLGDSLMRATVSQGAIWAASILVASVFGTTPPPPRNP